MTLTLYSMPSSGNSYKIRLMFGFLGLEYKHIGLEYETPELAEAHATGALPMGKLPVLVLDDGTPLPESNAILCFLAEGTPWMPRDPLDRARVLGWMFFEQNRHETVIAVRAGIQKYASRAHLATPERLAELLEAGHSVLQVMENHLAEQDWFVGDGPTVADVALYAYTHTAGPYGGFEMERFPSINNWLARVALLPGYVGLEELPE
ncbi:MAG: glutathione S-transferase family protein [Boseongicola sp.]|nr:glutathione S-transferase family protein [Boseongicola sp.]